MYTKRVRVRRGDKNYVYLKIVESYRENGRTRQRVVANLGREDELKASGQLEALAGALARLDPPMAGTRREVGPLLVVAHVLARLGVAGIVEAHLPDRSRSRLSPAEVVVALIANRLAAPSPLYDVAGWASQAAMAEVFAIPPMLLNDDRLGRVLEDFAPVAEPVRGAVALAAIEHFGVDASRLHLDLTALRVAGAYEASSLVQRGWGADRRIARQVQALAVTNREGVPLYMRPEPGAAAELSSIGAALERLAALLPPGLVVCADSALGRVKNLCEADAAGLGFVVPLRENTGFRGRWLQEVGPKAMAPLRYTSRREQHLPPAERTAYKGALRPWDVTDPATGERRRFRVAYIWSSEEQDAVRRARRKAIERAEEALGHIVAGLGGRYYKTKAQVDAKVAQVLAGGNVGQFLTVTTGERAGKPTLAFARDHATVRAAQRADGIYALATNLPGRLSATKVLATYKDQSLVECAHKNEKQTLRVRPIFLHNDDRIEALVSIVGLALVVFGLIEIEVRRALGDQHLEGLLPEGRAARPTGRNILAAFQGLGLTYTPEGIVLDRLTHTQKRILELLEVRLQWPEQGRLGAAMCGKRV
jgi:transposase